MSQKVELGGKMRRNLNLEYWVTIQPRVAQKNKKNEPHSFRHEAQIFGRHKSQQDAKGLGFSVPPPNQANKARTEENHCTGFWHRLKVSSKIHSFIIMMKISPPKLNEGHIQKIAGFGA